MTARQRNAIRRRAMQTYRKRGEPWCLAARLAVSDHEAPRRRHHRRLTKVDSYIREYERRELRRAEVRP